VLGMFIFLSSGLFLGWSLGANDAANVFGTAVGTKMVKFRIAAVIASVFVILGAVTMGTGAAHTLGELGSINAMGGAFSVALSAAITITLMTKLKLPVSTSQAIVGAIIGWNFFTGSLTDYTFLTKIVGTWVLCPVLAAIFSCLFYLLFKYILSYSKIHLITLDYYTRIGLILAGIFGSFSLGANNIANVMGVFVDSSPFFSKTVFGLVRISGIQQLFLLGGLSIALGIFTYSHTVMKTVGNSLFRLSPITAFVVVFSQSMVLFLFASDSLRNWLLIHRLPAFPLVPVSSSQAVIGAIIGIAVIKGASNVQYKVLAKITMGWITTPVFSCLLSFFLLFFIKNVFMQTVNHPVQYIVNEVSFQQLVMNKLPLEKSKFLYGKSFENAQKFNRTLDSLNFSKKEKSSIFEATERYPLKIEESILDKVDRNYLTSTQYLTLRILKNEEYDFKWQLYNELGEYDCWSYKSDIPEYKSYNKELKIKLNYLSRLFVDKTKFNNDK